MNTKIRQYASAMFFYMAASLLLVGCGGKPWMVKPPDGFEGSISISSITVTKTANIQSADIVSAVKTRLLKDVKRLKGPNPIDMKVTIDSLSIPLPGGGISAKLLGSSTKIKGYVELFNGGKIIAKYRVEGESSASGLLSTTSTLNFTDTHAVAIKNFSNYVIVYVD